VLVAAALGGNALLKRGEAQTIANQRANVAAAAEALAPIAARGHALVVTHGNGPQVGLLALQAEAYRPGEPAPLDVLSAETEGMIGYMIELELAARLPGRKLATVLTMVEVDLDDPAFARPAKPIGPLYEKRDADRLAAERGWVMARDGRAYRRVVPSPAPRRILEADAIALLVREDVIVTCAGGGGVPTARGSDGRLAGVEAVVDKDHASALLGRTLKADALLLLTDVDAVYAGWETRDAHPIRLASPDELKAMAFAPGSMGPKVEAACDFVEATGGFAAIGSLGDAAAMLDGKAGTLVRAAAAGGAHAREQGRT
jgi:carbamate kinase